MVDDDEAYTAAFDDGYRSGVRAVVNALHERADEWRILGRAVNAAAFRTAADYIEDRFLGRGA